MEEMIQALVRLFEPLHLLFLTLGTMLGLLVGILPGLGGIAGLSVLLPFVFGMEPGHALAMMIGLLAPTTTSDTFPSVLMGIPGTSGSQATVVDGFPMAKRGEGARALGAAFTASLFGGLFGALVLTWAIFVAEPLILMIGFGEQLLLILLALSMIGMLTGDNPIKGLATCGLGLMLGCIGAGPSGEERMAFNHTYLADGIPIVIIGLGMFAMPEIVDLLRRSRTISETGTLGKGWIEGFKDAFRHPFIVLRCSVIGCIVGALPGLGGSVVDWIAYGHVIQTTKHRERYGTGDIRGVLAPESANNAKEGGALIPTLLFGIPGSGSMAILLGGFILVDIQPGLDMIEIHLDLTYTIIWSLALANIIGAGTCLILAQPIAKLTTIPYPLLAPFMLVLIFFAAFQASRDWGDLIALFVIGTLGTVMKRFGWSRPALLIGFFLSKRLEASVYQSIQAYGLTFMERPAAQVLLVLTVLSIFAAVKYSPNKAKPAELTPEGPHAPINKQLQLIVTGVFIAFALFVMWDASKREFLGFIFPTIASITSLMLLTPVLFQQARAKSPHTALYDADIGTETQTTNLHYLLWIVGMIGTVALLGFPIAISVWVFIFLIAKAGGSTARNALLALTPIGFLGVMAYFLTLKYPGGLLQDFVPLPWWLGGG